MMGYRVWSFISSITMTTPRFLPHNLIKHPIFFGRENLWFYQCQSFIIGCLSGGDRWNWCGLYYWQWRYIKNHNLFTLCNWVHNYALVDWWFLIVVQQFSEEFSVCANDSNLPLKHDLVLSLAVGGRWITAQYNLQVGHEYMNKMLDYWW